MPDLPVCSFEKADFHGWQAVYLRNGLVSLAAVPDIGGRVMAFDLGGYDFFFVDRDLAGKLFSPEENQGDGSLAAWKNYGGDKTWPAPQGWDNDNQWHGPPDPVLDSGRYQLSDVYARPEVTSLTMVSQHDPRTGLQITRQVSLRQGSSHASLDLSFSCHADHPLRWSIWDVVQLRAERNLVDGRLTYETECSVCPIVPCFYRVIMSCSAPRTAAVGRRPG
jgi:hypothetical protein